MIYSVPVRKNTAPATLYYTLYSTFYALKSAMSPGFFLSRILMISIAKFDFF
jgi:hypothetical protein